MTYKTASTADIDRLANKAIEEERNQSLDPSFITHHLDPNGVHVCTLAMIHEHQAGKKVEPHMRTRWLLKLKGSMVPVPGLIDMSIEDYNALPDVEQEKVDEAKKVVRGG